MHAIAQGHLLGPELALARPQASASGAELVNQVIDTGCGAALCAVYPPVQAGRDHRREGKTECSSHAESLARSPGGWFKGAEVRLTA